MRGMNRWVIAAAGFFCRLHWVQSMPGAFFASRLRANSEADSGPCLRSRPIISDYFGAKNAKPRVAGEERDFLVAGFDARGRSEESCRVAV